MVMEDGARGRAASPVRTTKLIREFLGGDTSFPGDEAEDVAARATEGAYISRIHQAIRARIKEASQEDRHKYGYPRKHSFLTMVKMLLHLGLLEFTGGESPAESRGASGQDLRVLPGHFSYDNWQDSRETQPRDSRGMTPWGTTPNSTPRPSSCCGPMVCRAFPERR